jgi:hypothetical protein
MFFNEACFARRATTIRVQGDMLGPAQPWWTEKVVLVHHATRYAKSRFELLASFASASALVVTSSPEAETR